MEEFRANNILIKLIDSEEEKQKIYKLRYENLILDYNINNINELGIDKDIYDDCCDHIIAIDITTNEVVGGYRLISSEHIKNIGKFLTEKEFNIDKLKSSGKRILELGRAVVDNRYRDGFVINLLWKAVIKYAVSYNMDYMIGTASFHGTDPDIYKNCFLNLYQNYLSSENIRAQALNPCYKFGSFNGVLDDVLAKDETPPLVKGYLRLGATIGNDAFIDYHFNSIDVLISLEIKKINPRYLKRYLE